MTDQRIQTIIGQLLRRRDPTAQVLLEVEKLGSEGARTLFDLLDSGELSPMKTRRALQGLCYATKHLGYAEHRRLFDVALGLATTGDRALRSMAIPIAIAEVGLLKTRRLSAIKAGLRTESETELRQRLLPVVEAAREIGLDTQARRAADQFLDSLSE